MHRCGETLTARGLPDQWPFQYGSSKAGVKVPVLTKPPQDLQLGQHKVTKLYPNIHQVQHCVPQR